MKNKKNVKNRHFCDFAKMSFCTNNRFLEVQYFENLAYASTKNEGFSTPPQFGYFRAILLLWSPFPGRSKKWGSPKPFFGLFFRVGVGGVGFSVG